MPIEIRCDNVAGFDAATGNYQVCNQKLLVQREQLGKRLLCPKCKQPVKISPEDPAGSAAQPAAQVGGGSLDELRPKNDVMEMDFQTATHLRGQARYQEKTRCPKCGGQYSDSGICQTCGYVEPVQAAQRRQQTKKHDRPAGFQLWVLSLASDGVSMSSIGLAIFAVLVLFCSLVIVAGIFSTSIIGAIIAAVTAAVLLFVWLVFFTTRKIAKDNNASMGVLGPVWQMTLVAARQLKWQAYDPKLKDRKIIDKRSDPIDDGELATLDGLRECEVLDLENSEITDAGLKHLYSLTKLRCLVLKNTDVSREAVTTLQQQRPILWIWL